MSFERWSVETVVVFLSRRLAACSLQLAACSLHHASRAKLWPTLYSAVCDAEAQSAVRRLLLFFSRSSFMAHVCAHSRPNPHKSSKETIWGREGRPTRPGDRTPPPTSPRRRVGLPAGNLFGMGREDIPANCLMPPSVFITCKLKSLSDNLLLI